MMSFVQQQPIAALLSSDQGKTPARTMKSRLLFDVLPVHAICNDSMNFEFRVKSMKAIHAKDIVEFERKRLDEDLKQVPQRVIDGILELSKSNRDLDLIRALDAWILRAAEMGYDSWCVYQLQLRKTPKVHDVFFDFLEYAIENRNPQLAIPVLLLVEHPTAHRVPLTPPWQGFSKNVEGAFWRDGGWTWQREPGNHAHRAKFVPTRRPVPMVVMLDTRDKSTPAWNPAEWCAGMEASLDCDGASVSLLHDNACWWLHAFERARALSMGFRRGRQTGFPLCFLTENEAEYCFIIGESMRELVNRESAGLHHDDP